jgi:hypothetical protein
MQCPSCQATLPDNARFCNVCGAAIPQQVTCPTCGAAVENGQKFCMKCGTRITAVPAATLPAVAPTTKPQVSAPGPRRRVRWWLPVALLMFIVAAAAIVALLLKLPQRLAGLPSGVAPSSTPPVGTATTQATESALPKGESTPVAATPTFESRSSLAQRWDEVQARANSGAWQDVVTITTEIRATDASFRPEEVRQLRATACANLAQKTERVPDPASSQKWWDCVLVERPEDSAARDGRRRAEAYLSGRTAWEAKDYVKAIAAWQPLASEMAGYGDVVDRLYLAYIAFGDQLCALQGDENIQKAREQYSLARQLVPARPEALDKLRQCQLPTATPSPTPTPLPGPHIAELTGTDTLRVRAGPGAGYFVLGKLDAGTSVTVTGRTADSRWIYVEASPDRRGWVSGEYLKANYPLSAAPVTPTPPLARSIQVAQAGQDFSSRQGTNDWFYVISAAPGSLNFTQMPWDAETGKWYRWCCDVRYSPKMRLSDIGGHPSRQYDVARLWVSPYEGTLRITGRAYKESGDGRGGNGVRVRIVQNKTTLWEQGLGSYDTTGVSFDQTVETKVGDQFYFIINALGDDDKDNTIFDPTIMLQFANGADQPTPARWPETVTPGPKATPASSTSSGLICFEPRLRHFEEHKGCCAEIAGMVYNAQGQPYGPRGSKVRVEGPGGEYSQPFDVDPGGGYVVTALSMATYTISLRGSGISSKTYEVRYDDWAKIRAIVDFYQIPCN